MGLDPKFVEGLLKNVQQRKASSILGQVKVRANTKPRDRGPNKTEARYMQHLEAEKRAGRVVWYAFEPMSIRLADKCHFTPDFLVVDSEGEVTFVDTKAWWNKQNKPGITDDSLVKLKTAAEQFPIFNFIATWEKDGIWEERMF